MIKHFVASHLAVPAERFWHEQVSRYEPTSAETQQWPRTVTLLSRSLVGFVLHDTRTVEKTSVGCKVIDQIGTDTKFKPLRAFLVAHRLMKVKRLHAVLRSKYRNTA